MENIIKKRRQELGLTQKDVADYCKVTCSAVCKWQTGATGVRFDNIVDLATILRVNVNELIDTGVVTSAAPTSTDKVTRLQYLLSDFCSLVGYKINDVLDYGTHLTATEEMIIEKYRTLNDSQKEMIHKLLDIPNPK